MVASEEGACFHCCRESFNSTCSPDSFDVLPNGTPCFQGFCNEVCFIVTVISFSRIYEEVCFIITVIIFSGILSYKNVLLLL